MSWIDKYQEWRQRKDVQALQKETDHQERAQERALEKHHQHQEKLKQQEFERQKNAAQQDIKRRETAANKPRPKPPRIRPALTPTELLSASASGENNPKQRSQATSSLFTKLSYDVRCLVYREVLGNKCFHIVTKGRRLGFLYCQKEPDKCHRASKCWGGQNWIDAKFCHKYINGRSTIRPTRHPLIDKGQDTRSTDGDILPLLTSCHLVYSEAISLLYRENLFAFREPRSTFQDFCAVIPSHRLHEIRHLHIELGYFEYPHWKYARYDKEVRKRGTFDPSLKDQDEWNTFWQLVNQLHGIRTLEVRLTSPGEELPTIQFKECLTKLMNRTDDILKPFQLFRNLARFEIMLPMSMEPINDGYDYFRKVYIDRSAQLRPIFASERSKANKEQDGNQPTNTMYIVY